MARGRLVLVALLLGAPLAAKATDAPHEAGDGLCSNCHMGHNATGPSLTNQDGNFNLCQSCHVAELGFGFPWADGDQAVPGTSGRSHRWDAPATNRGATPPLGTPMAAKARLADGKLQCSTCHDQHEADGHAPDARGSQHVSVPVGVAQPPVGAGTGTLAVDAAVGAAAAAKKYLVEIVSTGSGATATFRLSNDNGKSWFGCAPSSYVYVAYAANACLAGASVPLNDGENVKVTFAGGAGELVAGDRWAFYVSYPYLRVANASAEMCTTCHEDRNMTWQNAEGIGPIAGTGQPVELGTTRFSHPVNQALNQGGRANGHATGILDANGMGQATSTDPNRSNDLRLGPGDVVTCLSCHHPHNADSNSLSEDPR
jgi:predicted CXXCH cytochrome family protein